MEVRVVMCTTNSGKLTEVRKYFAGAPAWPGVRVEVLSPAEAGLTQHIEVEEDQPTLEGNAAKKAREHWQHLTSSQAERQGGEVRRLTVVVADDTALAIEALNGEPGIKVRRWADGVTSMSDESIIQHCLARMRGQTNRKAVFRSVLAMVVPHAGHDERAAAASSSNAASPRSLDEPRAVEYFDGELHGTILEEADPMRIEGFPMESLFFVDEYQLLLGAVQLLPPEEKMKYPTHRQRMLERFHTRLAALARDAAQREEPTLP